MMSLSRGLLASACATALLAFPAASIADTATVRIEGDNVSLTKTVNVPTTGTFGAGNCPYDSAGGAIDVAVEQNWDRAPQRFTETILGETHNFSNNDYWEYWRNGSGSNVGICDTSQPLQEGDQILMIVQRSPNNAPTVKPLFITQAPASVERGTPATFTVVERSYNYPTTTEAPAAGVTVAAGGVSTTTDANGRAALTFPSAGSFDVRATGPSHARSNIATVVVTEPGQAANLPSAPVADKLAPKAFVASLNRRTFSRSRAPRLLKGKVDESGGILMVKLRLTRTTPGGRCFAYSGRREKFIRRPKCGVDQGWWFRIGDKAEWEYQLPERLGRGRYVLDVNAIDRAYNRDDERRRGENRAVFHVR